MKKNTKKNTSKIDLKKSIEHSEGSFNFSDLPLKDQKLIGKPHIDDPLEELPPKHEEFFNSPVYIGGALTDKEAIQIAKRGRKYIKEKVPFKVDEFVKTVENNHISPEQMLIYVSNLMLKPSEDKTFDKLISKIVELNLKKMELKELIAHKFLIEELIKEKVVPSKNTILGEE
jgi:hypothetical protein